MDKEHHDAVTTISSPQSALPQFILLIFFTTITTMSPPRRGKKEEEEEEEEVSLLDYDAKYNDNDNNTSPKDSTDSSSSPCHINQRMVSSKFAYFFEYAKEGSHWPYLVLFYVSIGLNPSQAGFVGGVRFIGGVLGAPICGWMADRTNRHRRVAVLVCVFAAVVNICQPVVSTLLGNPAKNFCHRKYSKLLARNHTRSPMSMRKGLGNSTEANELFYALILVSTLGAFFDGSTMGFVDSGVLRKMITSPTPTSIGKQRLFGPPGVGIAAFVSGLAVDHFPRVNISCYTGIFLIYGICCTGMAVTFYFLLSEDNNDQQRNNYDDASVVMESTNHITAASTVNELLLTNLKNPLTWVFLFIVFFNGMALALAFSFSFLFLEELHTPNSIKGISLCANGLSGLAGFVLSSTIIEKLGGNMNAMAASCFSWSLRYILLSIMKQPYQFLLICLLNGLTCSLFVSAYVGYVRDNFPPKIFTVVCCIAAALYNSGGYFVANIVGGVGYQNLGPRMLFAICSIACLGFAVFILVYGLVLRRWGGTPVKK